MTLPDKITASQMLPLAEQYMKPEEIDHHGLGHGMDDLYLKVTPVSRELVLRYEYIEQVNTFISNIEPHVPWFEIPFAYTRTK